MVRASLVPGEYWLWELEQLDFYSVLVSAAIFEHLIGGMDLSSVRQSKPSSNEIANTKKHFVNWFNRLSNNSFFSYLRIIVNS